MSTPVPEPRSYTLAVGDQGQLDLPAQLRSAHGWSPGEEVIALDSPGGVLLFSLPEALEHVRNASMVSVDEFLAGRRAEKVAEEKEMVEWGASSPTPHT